MLAGASIDVIADPARVRKFDIAVLNDRQATNSQLDFSAEAGEAKGRDANGG